MSRNLRRPGTCNPSANPSLDEVLARRSFLRAGIGAVTLAALPCAAQGAGPAIDFKPIAVSSEDALRVPAGYEARVLYRWGDPVGSAAGMPQFRIDASNSAADQALQAGMHHDGMHYFPIDGSRRGLLAINHEYTDQGLLYPDGMKTWSAEKVLKSQNAVGVSVIEVSLRGNAWSVVRPSKYARRITARTPCRIAGPAAGHPLMRTAGDPGGTFVYGTYAGCAHGWTPWGTYLTCEENWHGYFVNGGPIPADQQRYGVTARGFGMRWHEHDERFDAAKHRNEPNRFGWVVELDPFDPDSIPVKRTALGRIKHEGAACSIGADRRLAFYTGDDEDGEYIYKFVSARAFDPASRRANADLLDHGKLYAARFNADGSGEWLELTGADLGEVRVHTRQAADAAGATRLNRPEWVVPHPATREVFAALTGGRGNPFGTIVRWSEEGGDVAATRFRWRVFVRAGPEGKGTVQGDHFINPDSLWIDSIGTLWVGTDGPPSPLGNNQALAVDPASGVFRRFLSGPPGCEVTGFHTTPDNRTAFVNIQHPGEGRQTGPDSPRALSNWPDYAPDGRPRSATVAIRRKDGGQIGT
ncbi:MAG TPA: PhoX family phosphatase [Burkholderiales bacterium]